MDNMAATAAEDADVQRKAPAKRAPYPYVWRYFTEDDNKSTVK